MKDRILHKCKMVEGVPIFPMLAQRRDAVEAASRVLYAKKQKKKMRNSSYIARVAAHAILSLGPLRRLWGQAHLWA